MSKSQSSKVQVCCENCRTLFFVFPSRIADGKGRFCSRECATQFVSKANRLCETCRKPFHARKSYVDRNQARFCSHECCTQHILSGWLDRFTKQVSREPTANGCLEWKGQVNRKGYGIFSFMGGKRTTASRLAYIVENGPIASSLFVCHKCDNPPCCNPEHLFLGTQKDNLQDMSKKGRSPRGEKAGGVKLNSEKVNEIRRLSRVSRVPYSELGAQFGVTSGHISNIINRKVWGHI